MRLLPLGGTVLFLVLLAASAGAGEAEPVPDERYRGLFPASSAETAEKKPAPAGKTAVHGSLFLRYSLDLDEADEDANEFEIDRARLDVRSQLDGNWSARVVVDCARDDDPGTSSPELEAFVKRAYARYESGVFFSEIGLHGTPYVGWESEVWGLRYIARALVDEEKGLCDEDIGVSTGGQVGGRVDYHVGIYNGTGGKKPEDDEYKSLQARVTVSPFQGKEWLRPVRIAVYGDVGEKFSAGDWQADSAVSLCYVGEKWRCGFEIFNGRKGKEAGGEMDTWCEHGYSGFAVVDVWRRSSVYARVDFWDPDTGVTSDHHTRTLLGVQWRAHKKVRIAFGYESVNYKDDCTPDDHRLVLHTETKW